MEGGLFLLLCLLALVIGTKVRQGKENRLSEKAIIQRKKIKRFMMIIALILVVAILVLYIPYVYTEILVSIDTHFNNDIYISLAILVVASLTISLIVSRLFFIRTKK